MNEKLGISQNLSDIRFQQLEKHHLPLIVKWLNEPHVWKWWGEGKVWTISDIEAKYSSYLEQYKIETGIKKPIYPFIICLRDTPIGYIQYYNAFDFPRQGYAIKDIWKEPASSLAALDFYVGDLSCLGKGIGSIVLRGFLKSHVYHRFSTCLVDPEKDNFHAVRAYEKAGFKIYCEQGSNLIMLAKAFSS